MDAWRNWQVTKKTTPKKAVDPPPNLQCKAFENALQIDGDSPRVSDAYVLVPVEELSTVNKLSDLNSEGSG